MHPLLAPLALLVHRDCGTTMVVLPLRANPARLHAEQAPISRRPAHPQQPASAKPARPFPTAPPAKPRALAPVISAVARVQQHSIASLAHPPTLAWLAARHAHPLNTRARLAPIPSTVSAPHVLRLPTAVAPFHALRQPRRAAPRAARASTRLRALYPLQTSALLAREHAQLESISPQPAQPRQTVFAHLALPSADAPAKWLAPLPPTRPAAHARLAATAPPLALHAPPATQ